MSSTKSNARGGAKVVQDAPFTEVDGTTGAAIDPKTTEIPIDIEGEADNRSQLTKLSMSMMGCQPELSMKRKRKVTIEGVDQEVEVGEEVHQATIYGYITGLTGPKELPNAKNGQDAITYGLTGMIEGLNVRTGEIFKGGVLYLPAGFHDMFLAEMEMGLKAAGPGNVQIAFALDMFSIPADNPRGYSWKAKSKLPQERHDPLARLRARALAGTKVVALNVPSGGKALPSGGIA